MAEDAARVTGAADIATAELDWQKRELPVADINPPSLGPAQIHLWCVALLDDTENATKDALGDSPPYCELLNQAERARASRIQTPIARAIYLRGRICLRILLRGYTGLANPELAFRVGVRGKPELANTLPQGELQFNYSLSDKWALYAVGWNRELGVDLETLPRPINAENLAKRKLTAAERRTWAAFPPAFREQAMLACWTRKEAYGKALGVGIRYFLNRVPLFLDPDAATWRVAAQGLFAPLPAPKMLHGVQLPLPFAGVAALMYGGEALSAAISLRAWCGSYPKFRQ